MRIGVTGYKGNIGSRMVKGYGYTPLVCDICKPEEINGAIQSIKPDVILHLAGKAGVNWCEAQENQEDVMQTNFRGSASVFEVALKANIPVVYVSSDHIFSGNGFGNYKEESKPHPKNFYGMSKLAVESLRLIYPNVSIVRTSTLFWKESKSVSGILADIKAGKNVPVPTYLWRTFLHIDHFCEMLNMYCTKYDEMPNILNLSGSKLVSWYKFIKDYAVAQGLDSSKVRHKYFEDKNHSFAPRAMRAGLNTDLSDKLGYPQYSYLDGIK